MDVIVVGGGIGGLTAAVALTRQGHRVEVCSNRRRSSPRWARACRCGRIRRGERG
ncbi:FAD-dependent oxidoreductase [Actinomadura sp. DC4]|uniref:FAD-dependent oxidoreductase n=1 Tax=Actinomadura sp. DC4 TaxID=3055069 RepID=UPI0025B05D37|nr:FAD-dependent oxidoreductase [Actinomadura sp. DC4]MDN3358805.1 FAD-dependent oxidoreductase [Actinomadura sp. DC4]